MSSIEDRVTDGADPTPSSEDIEDVEFDSSDEAEQGERPPEPSLSVDVIFEVLKNERRRRVIEYLQENEGPAELGSVAEHIAALENDKDEAAITYAERKRVYVGLYQCHLPKMDDMGVVDFNRARGRIELTDQATHLDPYLKGPVSHHPWYRYYGAIVLGGLGIYGTTFLQSVSAATIHLALGGVLVALALCTFCHSIYESGRKIPELSIWS
jgi:hypothetical protein